MPKSSKMTPSSKTHSKKDILEQKGIHLNCIGDVDFKSIDKDIVFVISRESVPTQDTISVPKDKAQDIIAKLRQHPKVCGIEGEILADRWPGASKNDKPEEVKPTKHQLEKILAAFEKLKNKKEELETKAKKEINEKQNLV